MESPLVPTGSAAGPESTASPGRKDTLVEVVGLLGNIVGRMRTPLLLIVLLPAFPAAVLALAAANSGSPDREFGLGLAVIGMIPSAWLAVRRWQLVTALVPAATAVAQLRAAFSVVDVAGRVKDNLLQMRRQKTDLRPRQLARGLWSGIKVSAAVHSRMTNVPALAPFFPGRLRGLAYLGFACLASAAVLTVFAVALVIASFVGLS